MGMRINVAIGWGMPFALFQTHALVPNLPSAYGDEWGEVLETFLEGTGPMRGPTGWPLPVIDADKTAFDLITTVGYDHCSDVILHPSSQDAREWHRRDDDIDYAVLWGPRAPDDHETPNDKVEYLTTGLHPYGDLRMAQDGVELERPNDDTEYEWLRNPDLLPGVPPTLRHWTVKTGLLDLRGVAALRPMRAIWWA